MCLGIKLDMLGLRVVVSPDKAAVKVVLAAPRASTAGLQILAGGHVSSPPRGLLGVLPAMLGKETLGQGRAHTTRAAPPVIVPEIGKAVQPHT